MGTRGHLSFESTQTLKVDQLDLQHPHQKHAFDGLFTLPVTA